MKFAIATLGCKVNQYDSELIREALTASGHAEQPFNKANAQLYIINTCTVTHRADAENRKLIRKALRQGPDARIIATGCQAVTNPYALRAVSDRVEVIALPQLDKGLNIDIQTKIRSFHGHSRAFVKVQQGCNMFCTYCIVPYARGTPISRPQEEITEEIDTLHKAGYNEVVLTGINIGLYNRGIADLIKKILMYTRIPRVRISSIEPWTIDNSLLAIMAYEPRVCRHIHLPLQSGSDRILRAMGRPYNKAYYNDLIKSIRSMSKDIAIGTDIMVGFPGEDEDTFEETVEFVEGLDIAYMHIFPYSKRPGTKAARFKPDIDTAIKRQRVSKLRAISCEKRMRFALSQIGCKEDILVLNTNIKTSVGMTSNYLKVCLPGNMNTGDIVEVDIKAMKDSMLLGYING
ncbi:MAG: MiaB/RimO family radical SAM methylthiotransferase [Deltaproteobacteria bacterium]|nr:MiaB/RimO family radical SAM methylthiotransferase [Deltaproteobacteria bacterium]